MGSNNHQKPLDTSTFSRVQKWYLLALTAIAPTILLAQLLMPFYLNAQLNHSRVINVAGRQSAFSQKFAKEISKNNSDGGMGLFFMKEGIHDCNGALFINSELGKGTRVTINYKTNKKLDLHGT